MLTFADDNRHYSEFHFGDWKSFVIWNQTSIDNDGVVMDRGHAAQPTPRGSAVPMLNAWISSTFDTSKLKLARIHSLGDGVLVPHRDFVEFNSTPWSRVHIPLLTNQNCLHSDTDIVFHMRSGEIWFLDASQLHSAINYSAGRRLNLCLDFDLRGEPVDAVFRKSESTATCNTPKIVERRPLSKSFGVELASLAATLTRSTLQQAVGLLSRVHFFREAGRCIL
ncbi:L-proline 3-hydroxylase [Candidatus Burkholderia humilis]|nr:L-proline 3-hydroxylase [Candidatus Burkholderia humilis]